MNPHEEITPTQEETIEEKDLPPHLRAIYEGADPVDRHLLLARYKEIPPQYRRYIHHDLPFHAGSPVPPELKITGKIGNLRHRTEQIPSWAGGFGRMAEDVQDWSNGRRNADDIRGFQRMAWQRILAWVDEDVSAYGLEDVDAEAVSALRTEIADRAGFLMGVESVV